jgi:hypothetical protein
MFVSSLNCNFLVPRTIHYTVKIEAVATFYHDYVVLLLHGNGKVGVY